MKTYLLFFIVVLQAILLGDVRGQNLSVSANSQALIKDTVPRISSFTGTYNSGKVYLKWSIANQHEDGIYLVYRSADGVDYENIGSKQGIGVPISKEISYYFSDTDPLAGTSHYRIVHISGSKKFLNSDKINVDGEKKELVAK